jgi:hypothetical protein
VRIKNVVVTRGYNTDEGGGIANGGSLTLVNSVVRDSSSGYAGGGIENGGDLTLRRSTSVRNNSSPNGGGIVDDPVNAEGADGAIVLDGTSSVRGNLGTEDGGGIYIHAGTLTLNDSSSVRDSFAENTGGGVKADFGGALGDTQSITMTGSASITRNRVAAGGNGGGIAKCGSVITTGVRPGVNVKHNYLGETGTNEDNVASVC